MNTLKTLSPKESVWLMFKRLPTNTTEELFAEFLRSAGLDIGPANVAILPPTPTHINPAAICALPKEEIARLVTWLLSDKLFAGQTLTAILPPFPSRRPGTAR